MVHLFSSPENIRVLWSCSEHLRANFSPLHYLVLYFCHPPFLLYNLWIKHTVTTVWPSIFLSLFPPAEFPTFWALLPQVLQFWAALFKADLMTTLKEWFYTSGFRMRACQDINAAPLQGNSLTGGGTLWFLNDSSLCLFPTNFLTADVSTGVLSTAGI